MVNKDTDEIDLEGGWSFGPESFLLICRFVGYARQLKNNTNNNNREMDSDDESSSSMEDNNNNNNHPSSTFTLQNLIYYENVTRPNQRPGNPISELDLDCSQVREAKATFIITALVATK